MDWNSRRITAVLQNALLEDRATRDATSYACIDPNQRATGTVIAKQDCILSGVGSIARILDVYAALDGLGARIARLWDQGTATRKELDELSSDVELASVSGNEIFAQVRDFQQFLRPSELETSAAAIDLRPTGSRRSSSTCCSTRRTRSAIAPGARTWSRFGWRGSSTGRSSR